MCNNIDVSVCTLSRIGHAAIVEWRDGLCYLKVTLAVLHHASLLYTLPSDISEAIEALLTRVELGNVATINSRLQ